MNEQTIQKGNLLITEFDGYSKGCDGIGLYFFKGSLDAVLRIDGLKYHSSWDWLMPVVEKISGSGYAGGIMSDLKGALIIADIEAVYNAVIEFIEWYNKKTGKPEVKDEH